MSFAKNKEIRERQEAAGVFPMFEKELRKVAYEFADACVAKAMLRLKQHPERSAIPHREYSNQLHKRRLSEEYAEWVLDSDNPSELEDIGNFAAWLWWRLNR